MQSFDGAMGMEKQFFFDKRYSRPFSFDGVQIFNQKNKDSEIKTFEVVDREVKKYIFVYIGKNNTELYKADSFKDLIDFFDPIDSTYLDFLKKNCNLAYYYNSDILKKKNYKVFGESYELYNFKKDNFNILIIKVGDEFKWDILGGIIDNLGLYRNYLSFFILKKISLNDNFRLSFSLKRLYEDKIKILNESTDGEKLFDTGVNSIKEKSIIKIYGNKIICIESSEYENCRIIESKTGFYLILNDTIYFDFNRERLLLLLSENSFTSFFEGIDQKYHMFLDDLDNEVHEIFKNKKYNEEVIKLKLKERKSGNNKITNSFFLMKDYYMNSSSCLNYFNIEFDSDCGDVIDQELKIVLKNNKLIDFYSSYPILTNLEIILRKEKNGTIFYLLKGRYDLLVVVESKNKNYFYNIQFDRILFRMIENKIVPFTFQEVFNTEKFLKPNNLDDLMCIQYEKI